MTLAVTAQMRKESQRNLALETAADGLPVFPVNATPLKPWKGSPLNEHGRLGATADAAQVEAIWRQHPGALVSIPTGTETGIAVLDVDPGGEPALQAILARHDCDGPADLSPCYATTPSGGLHLYFRIEPGTAPRTRSSDIAPKIDTRALGGSIIIPGNVRTDGRAYQWQGGTRTLFDAPPMPAWLLYLATFSRRERDLIKATHELTESMRLRSPSDWAAAFDSWQRQQQEAAAERAKEWAEDGDGMRRQALHDLGAVVREFAELKDGRRQKLYSLACRVSRYVTHGVLTENEFRSAMVEAARANGSLERHGITWAVKTLRSAIIAAKGDKLPPLARAFRSEVRA